MLPNHRLKLTARLQQRPVARSLNGKYYDHGSTEIISMGMQWLAEDPLKFYQKDPEFFELMMKIAGNTPW